MSHVVSMVTLMMVMVVSINYCHLQHRNIFSSHSLSWISFALTMTKTNIMVTMMMVLMNATGDADSAQKNIVTAAFRTK